MEKEGNKWEKKVNSKSVVFCALYAFCEKMKEQCSAFFIRIFRFHPIDTIILNPSIVWFKSLAFVCCQKINKLDYVWFSSSSRNFRFSTTSKKNTREKTIYRVFITTQTTNIGLYGTNLVLIKTEKQELKYRCWFNRRSWIREKIPHFTILMLVIHSASPSTMTFQSNFGKTRENIS